MIDFEDSRERAKLFAWLSLVCSSVALMLAVASSSQNLSAPGLGLGAGVAIVGLLLGLVGLDARHASAEPKPYLPVAAMWFALVVAIGTTLIAALVSDILRL